MIQGSEEETYIIIIKLVDFEKQILLNTQGTIIKTTKCKQQDRRSSNIYYVVFAITDNWQPHETIQSRHQS